MRDYIITVNSTVDTGKEWLEERNVPVIPLKYTIDGQEYTDMYACQTKNFPEAERGQDVSDLSDQSGGSKRDARAICKRRKGCVTSGIFCQHSVAPVTV